MRVKAIVPEANEWVQTVTAIRGSGATAKDREGHQLRRETHVDLPIGTVCLVVNSISTEMTRREWQRLAILDEEGHWLDIDRSSKTNRDCLATTARSLLKLEEGERLRQAVEGVYQRAWSRDYHLQNWVRRLEAAIHKFPQQFLDALDSRHPTLKLPTALPGERFLFCVERGAKEKGLAMLTDALARTKAELELVRSTISDTRKPVALKSNGRAVFFERRSLRLHPVTERFPVSPFELL